MWYCDNMENISDKDSEGLVLKTYFWNLVPNMKNSLSSFGLWFLVLPNNSHSIYFEEIFVRITTECLNFKIGGHLRDLPI